MCSHATWLATPREPSRECREPSSTFPKPVSSTATPLTDPTEPTCSTCRRGNRSNASTNRARDACPGQTAHSTTAHRSFARVSRALARVSRLEQGNRGTGEQELHHDRHLP